MTSISIHIIANQSSYHDDKSTLQCFTCVFCPPLIRNVRSRRRIDSSSIIAHPVNSDLHTWEGSLKCYAKNSTYMYIYIYLYDALDNRHGFSTWDWLHHFSQFLFMKSLKKKMFFKILKSWQVCDWLAKWIIMLRFMDLRWPRVFRRSNAGLVIVRRAGLLWSQQDFEWRWSVPLFKCLTVLEFSFILFDLCLLITFWQFYYELCTYCNIFDIYLS